MKKLSLIAILIAFTFVVKAQDPLFLKGDKLINLGLGISYFPNIMASLDYCIADGIVEKGSIGVGPYVGLGKGFGNVWGDYSFIFGGARGTFHYPFIEKLDTYAGFGLGLRIAHSSWSGYSNSTHFVPGFFLGANYPLTEKIVAFGELGSGVSYLTVGISLAL